MANFEIDEEVLVAFLKGELDAAQAAAVEAWYDRSAANRRMLGQVYYILYVSDRINDAAGIDVERSLRQFKRRMHAGRPYLPAPERGAYSRCGRDRRGAPGPAGSRPCCFPSAWRQPRDRRHPAGRAVAGVLPDGTKVWLNSSSSVEYVAPFFSRQRRVKMEGEAYFEVEHDRGRRSSCRPTAWTSKSSAHVSTSATTTTSIVSPPSCSKAPSRPMLRDASRPRAPAPRAAAGFDTRTHAMRLTDCPSAERSINWIDGRFCFEHDTFGEIVAELKRYYNVDIRFMDTRLRDMRFSGNFRVEDGIYHIMSVLQLTYKFNYRIAGNDIELYANPER